MSDGPSRLYLVIGGVVVATIWATAGVFAYNGTWWPLIVVGSIAGSALVVSMGMALFVRARSGPRAVGAPASASVGRDAPPPRADGLVGPRGRGNNKRKRKRHR